MLLLRLLRGLQVLTLWKQTFSCGQARRSGRVQG